MARSFPTRQVLAHHVDRASRHLAFEVASPGAMAPFELVAVAKAVSLAPLQAMVLGVDVALRAMAVDEVAEFGDPFTRSLLLAGIVPTTVSALAGAIDQLAGEHSRPLRKLYAIAEGAHFQRTGPSLPLNARLVFTWQKDAATDPDIFLSTTTEPDDPRALLQLISWSEVQGVYHFFERLSQGWVWAGSSLDALRPATRGKGPFDSHINGGLVMKELKFPWVHWHSQSRSIDRGLLFPSAELNANPLFAKLEGAQVLEAVVQRGIRRWTRRRIQHDLQANSLANLRLYMRQLLWTTSVNLASSDTLAVELSSIEEVELPASFLLDVDGFRAIEVAWGENLELLPPNSLSVASASYRSALRTLGARMQAEPGGLSIEGDTDFAFTVPERAFEDTVVLEQLLVHEVLSPKLALCLLMIDFCNPIFSPERAALLDLVPEVVEVGKRGAALDALLVEAARLAVPGTPARRLVELWDTPDLPGLVRQELAEFAQAAQSLLHSDTGIVDVLRLADSRSEAFRGRRLNEFRHTTTTMGATVAHLAFDASANVVQKRTSTGEQEL